MDTDRQMYIAWLEIQLGYEKLEQEWRDARRGKNADHRYDIEEDYQTEENTGEAG
jgi:hypothetical protein